MVFAAIEKTFDINIICDRKDGYKYHIENVDLINESHHMKRRINFEDIPSGQKYLTPIIKAMRNGHTIELSYKSFWRQDKYDTEIEPYFVKIFRQRWYLIARNIEKNALRTYALDRVIGIRETETDFVYPKKFDPEEYFYNSFGIIIDDDYPAEPIRLRVNGMQREYFRTLPLHHSQKETETGEDYSVFSYYLSPTYDFLQEILSRGSEVEVLTPAHLREEVKNMRKQLFQKADSTCTSYSCGEYGAYSRTRIFIGYQRKNRRFQPLFFSLCPRFC